MVSRLSRKGRRMRGGEQVDYTGKKALAKAVEELIQKETAGKTPEEAQKIADDIERKNALDTKGQLSSSADPSVVKAMKDTVEKAATADVTKAQKERVDRTPVAIGKLSKESLQPFQGPIDAAVPIPDDLFQSLREQLTSIQTDTNTMTDQLTSVAKIIQDLKGKLAEDVTTQQGIQKSLEDTKLELQKISAERDGLKSQVADATTTREERDKLREELSALKGTSESMKTEQDNLKQKLQQSNQTVEDTKAKIASLNEIATKIHGSVSGQRETITRIIAENGGTNGGARRGGAVVTRGTVNYRNAAKSIDVPEMTKYSSEELRDIVDAYFRVINLGEDNKNDLKLLERVYNLRKRDGSIRSQLLKSVNSSDISFSM